MNHNKILRIDNLNHMSIDAVIEAYRNGYVIEGIEKSNTYSNTTSIKGLSVTCPPGASLTQGVTKNIETTPSGGTPPYKVEFIVDGTVSRTDNVATSGTLLTYPFVFNQTVGPHTYTIKITDSCGGASNPSTNKVVTEICTLNITIPIGSIQCTSTPTGARIWLDGVNTGYITPYTLTSIPVGSHTITFKMTDYADCSQTVSVTSGSTVNATCTLTLSCPTNLTIVVNMTN